MLFRSWEATEEKPAVTTVTDHVQVTHVVVSGHAQVRQVLTNPDTFRPDNALDAVTPLPVAALRILARHGFRLPPTLANNGTPSHPGVRAIVADALRPDQVASWQPWLTGVVRRRIAGLAARLRTGASVDLYQELAADLPLLVLGRMMELPDADTVTVKNFSQAALELFWSPLDQQRQLALAETVGRFHQVLRACAATAGGMVGRLREHTQTHQLDRDTVVGALFFLLVAGQETTSQFLTLLLHRLAGEPTVLADLANGQLTIADIVEEGLRTSPPIVSWRRVTAVDTVLDGVAIPAGTSVVLQLAQAGRDQQLTTAPAAFLPGQRGSRRHLAFGAGAHRCLGAQLARMEAAVVVTEAAPLLQAVQVVRSPWCLDNLSFRIPDALVVRRSPADSSIPRPGPKHASRPTPRKAAV